MHVNIVQGNLSLNLLGCRTYGESYTGVVRYFFTLKEENMDTFHENSVSIKNGFFIFRLFRIDMGALIEIESLRCTRKKANFQVMIEDGYVNLFEAISESSSVYQWWKTAIFSADNIPFELSLSFRASIPKNLSKLVGMYCCTFATTPEKLSDCSQKDNRKGLQRQIQVHTNEASLLATFFEPNYASLCFPCFNDASVRLHWALEFLLESDRQVISNMQVSACNMEKHSHKKGVKHSRWIKFQTTPKIPSYLLAWVIAEDFSVFQDTGCQSAELCVFVPQRATHSENLPQEVVSWGTKTLMLCNEFFGVSLHPLRILQLVLLPDMHIGGMENHGLICLNLKRNAHIFNASRKEATKSDEKEFFSLLVHEIIHHWIGNVLGMCFLLKEGITQYLEKAFYEMISKDVTFYHAVKRASRTKISSASQIPEIRARMKKRLQGRMENCFDGPLYMYALQEIDHLAALIGPAKMQVNLQRLVQNNLYKYLSFDEVFDGLLS